MFEVPVEVQCNHNTDRRTDPKAGPEPSPIGPRVPASVVMNESRAFFSYLTDRFQLQRI